MFTVSKTFENHLEHTSSEHHLSKLFFCYFKFILSLSEASFEANPSSEFAVFTFQDLVFESSDS